jgi:hypothetical protein
VFGLPNAWPTQAPRTGDHFIVGTIANAARWMQPRRSISGGGKGSTCGRRAYAASRHACVGCGAPFTYRN